LDTAINKAEEPWTETETKINDLAQAMATYSRAFQNKTGLQADAGNGMDDYKKEYIDTPQENQL
jgi:hypothetical protein